MQLRAGTSAAFLLAAGQEVMSCFRFVTCRDSLICCFSHGVWLEEHMEAVSHSRLL